VIAHLVYDTVSLDRVTLNSSHRRSSEGKPTRFERRSASPGLVASRRATVKSQGTLTCLPPPKRGERPVTGFPNRYGIPYRLWFARRQSSFPPSSRAPEFSFGLGPTHPCAKAVHTEPFPSSILQVPARAPATTTKICTDVGSGRAHAQTLPRTTPRPSYSPRPELVILSQARG